MSEPTEREDLEQLLTSPGWLRFTDYAKREWGPVGYGRKLKQAVSQAIEHKQDAAVAVQRVDAVNDEINALLSYPNHRINELLALEAQRKQAQEPPLSRRGTL
jgi:hypothetical protein